MTGTAFSNIFILNLAKTTDGLGVLFTNLPITMTLGMVPTPDMKLQQEPMGAHFLPPNNTEKKILVRKTVDSFITHTYQKGKGTE